MLHALLCFGAPVAAPKIDSLTTYAMMKEGYVFVEVKSGDLIGHGQCSYNNEHTDLMSTLSDKVHAWIGPHVLGQTFATAADIDAFAETAWRKNYKRTGTTLAMALAGVDTALWDLVAQSQNVTVCSLVAAELGSTCKTQVPVYGSNGARDKAPEDIVANAVHNRDTFGVRAFKFQIENRMGGDVDIKPGRTEALIPLARQQLGPDVFLMADANGGCDNATHALQVARLLAANNFTWFEEPFPYWEYGKAAALSAQVPGLGIALGEQEYRLDVWERNIHAMEFAQPDVHYVGGLSRALRVAKMSAAAGTTFVPHSPNPSMIDLFALSLMAAAPNAFGFMEFDAINTRHPPSGDQFFTEDVYSIKDGKMAVPQGAGWGVTFKAGLLANAINQTTTAAAAATAWWF